MLTILAALLVGVLCGWVYTRRSKPKAIAASAQSSTGSSKLICGLIVRADLKMGKGKTAAQCCHASLGLWTECENTAWANSDYPHLLYKANTEDQLHSIAKKAQAEGVNWYLVADAGRTQIDPGSKTVLGVGPCDRDKLAKIVGELPSF